jgi:hypothetical protein
MCPLLGELAMLVDELIEKSPIIGAEAREQHLIVGRNENVDVVELEYAEPF